MFCCVQVRARELHKMDSISKLALRRAEQRRKKGEQRDAKKVLETRREMKEKLDETTRRFALARLKICFGGPKAMSQALANGERLKKGILLEGIGKVEGLSPAAADVAAGEAEESRPGTSEGAAAPAVAEEVQ